MTKHEQVVIARSSFSSTEALCFVASLTGDIEAKVEKDIIYPYYCFDADCSVPTMVGRKKVSLICMVDAVNGIGATADNFVLKNETVPSASLLPSEINDEEAGRIADRTVTHALGKKLRTITSFDVALKRARSRAQALLDRAVERGEGHGGQYDRRPASAETEGSVVKKLILSAVIGLVLGACEKAPEDTRTAVDTILHNGKIATIDASLSIASAVAVKGETIVAVGGEELLDDFVADNTIDLGGKFVMPGFVDSHTHLRGQPQRYIDLTKTTSIEEIKDLVRQKVDELGTGEWISGYGWSEDFMAELRRPLRADLDVAAPENPVLLTRAGGHSAVANSAALRRAEVDENTPQPEGGVIEKGEDGLLNGVIRERQEIVGHLIPEATNEEVRDSLIDVLKEQLSLGITSFTHATGSIEAYPEWEYIYSLHRGCIAARLNPGVLGRVRKR